MMIAGQENRQHKDERFKNPKIWNSGASALVSGEPDFPASRNRDRLQQIRRRAADERPPA
jgi:hypothetical protein